MHEPRNRIETPLPLLEIRVDHAGGSLKTCPNGAAISVALSSRGEPLPQGDFPGLMPGSELFDPSKLKPVPGLQSAISGEPAVMYRSDDVEIPLSPPELVRFLGLALRPQEFMALRERWGVFHEIHEDFYHPGSGAAFQPKIDYEEPADGPLPG